MSQKYQLLIVGIVAAIVSGLAFWGFAEDLFSDVQYGPDFLAMAGTLIGFMAVMILLSAHSEAVSEAASDAHRIGFQMGLEEAQRRSEVPPVSEWHKV